jgi:hypothetical protein
MERLQRTNKKSYYISKLDFISSIDVKLQLGISGSWRFSSLLGCYDVSLRKYCTSLRFEEY